MIITKHGNKRIKERVGFDQFQVMYHGFLYIFALGQNLEPILVTTYQVNTVNISYN